MNVEISLSPEDLAEVVERVTASVLERLVVEPPSELLTVAEAAEFLRAKPQRVYDLLSERRLTRHKDGSRVLVSRAELESHVGCVAHSLPGVSRSRLRRGFPG